MVYLSIVIPCHNEEKSLPILGKKLELILNQHLKNDWEIILVNDASTDKTLSIMHELHKKNKRFVIKDLKKRGGQTGSFRVAFSAAKGKFILRMDGDLQDDPEDLPLFINKMKQNYDVIIGIREARKHSRLLRFISQVYNSLAILFFNSPFHEASASYVGFKARYLKGLKLAHNDHRYLVVLAQVQGIDKPGEVVTRHHARVGGQSKYKKWKKFFLGFFELLLVLIRVKIGYYKRK